MASYYNLYKPVPLPKGWGGPTADPLVLPEESKEKLIAQAQDAARKLVEYAYDTSRFSKSTEKEGVTIATTSVGDLFLVRGRTTFKGSLAMLAKWRAADTSSHYCTIMSRIDPTFVCGRTIAHVQGKPIRRDGAFNMLCEPELPFLAVRWSLFDAPWPVWKRDIVHLEYNATLETGEFVQASMSVDIPECPSLESAEIAVRADLAPSGYVWREIEGGLVELTYCVQLDAKGSIPNWVQNAVAPQQALNCARVRDSLLQLDQARVQLDKAGGKLDTVSLALDIAAGKKHKLVLTVKPGDVLEYEFIVADKDIGLSFENARDRTNEMQRYKAGTLHTGRVTAFGGKMTMFWDNSYSRFTAKTVFGRHRLIPYSEPTADAVEESVSGAGVGVGAGSGSGSGEGSSS